MNNTESYILSSNCLFVKGHSKNLLIDIQRGDWYHIDFDLPDIDIPIEKFEMETLSHLIDNQIILKIPDSIKNQFPKLKYEYDFPAIIESVIIDRNKDSIYSIPILLSKLDDFLTKFYQFRFFDAVCLEDLEKILKYTENTIVESIDFIVPFDEEIFNYVSLNINSYPKINSVIFTNFNKDVTTYKVNNKFIFTSQEIKSDSCCGIVHPSFFSSNKKHIFKSMNYNSCLYKKIGVDVNGKVKNCPSMKDVICSFEDLQTIDVKQLETDYWFINKDTISVCKDCEFRYICTDCRVKVVNDEHSRPSSCIYNPYTNKWKGQEGYEKPELYK
ncbi:MAG: grasp-with-spasm system SPASM domain peptide maturase [Crocinitomicaceae bacterium]|nr:grasp-with-spasm system SPASM domain peptide maturase [Crocinitomicaceae bacterium]